MKTVINSAAVEAGAKAPAFQTRFAHDVHKGTEFTSPSRTMQQFKQESSIDFLIQRYRKTGSFYDALALQSARQPQFGDFSEVPDFKSALDTVNRCNALFYRLPATVRAQFSNDISTFIAFAGNPANLKRCIELGVFPGETLGGSGDSSPDNVKLVTDSKPVEPDVSTLTEKTA